MSRDRSIRQLFSKAHGMHGTERVRFLDGACAGDQELRREVESLLSAGSKLDGFLEEPAVDLTRDERPVERPGRIGPYVILDVLGRGGMGVVYLAEHADHGERVALKTVKVPEASLVAGVRREIRALGRLAHPGIVRIRDDGIERGMPWYSMELVQGVTLLEWVQERARIGVLGVVRKLCAALAYLHGEGFVHRDIKPANVLVRADGTPVLVDFGLMTQFTTEGSREVLEAVGESVGTAAYVAPEQGSAELVDARADLYALGVMLYELVARRLPFTGESDVEVLGKRYTEEPAPPSSHATGVPEELDALVLGLLARDVGLRTGHAGVVGAALARLGGGDDTLPGPPARSYLYRPALCGRDDALGELLGRLDHVAEGRGELVHLRGESGVGKTRLALALCTHARQRRMEVLVAECAPGSALPLGAFRPILASVADICRAEGIATTERLLGDHGPVLAPYEPAIASLPGQERRPTPAELPPRQAAERVWRALAGMLDALGRHRDTLVIMEDLQWADELTLGALGLIGRTRDLASCPLLLVATSRSEDEVALEGSEGASRIDVGRLSADSIEQMVAGMLAMPLPPPALVEHLVGHSEGIPLYVAEYLHLAVDEGILARDDQGIWQLARDPSAVGGLAIPRSILSLVTLRIDRLEASDRALAGVAAVLGRESEEDVLGEVAGMDEGVVMESLTRLSRLRLLEPGAHGRLRFSHDKIRELVYAAIPEEQLTEAHRRAAQVLQARCGTKPESQGALGHHWERAREPGRARACYLAGARFAADAFAHDHAESLYASYLRLVESPTEESVESRQELAMRVLHLRGETEAAGAQYRAAITEARTLGLRSVEARCLRLLGRLLHGTGRLDEAETVCRESVAIASDLGEAASEGQGIYILALLHRDRGRMREARELAERALVLARSERDRRFEGMVLGQLAVLHEDECRFDLARELYEQAIAIHRERGNRPGEGVEIGNLAGTCIGQGRFEEARAHLEAALAIHREVGNRQSEGMALGNLAGLHDWQGRSLEAERLLEQALAIVREVGDRRMEGVLHERLAGLLVQAGRLDDARSLYERARDVARELQEPRLEARTCSGLGAILLLRGDTVQARELQEHALAIHRRVGDRRFESMVLRDLATLAGIEGEMQHALALGERALSLARDVGSREIEGRTLGQLATLELVASGDLVRAAALAMQAESILEEAGAPSELALLLCTLGHIRLAGGGSATVVLARAQALAGESAATGQGELGNLLAKLARAQSARDASRPLVAGFCPEDLGPGELAWLRRERPSAIPAEPRHLDAP